MLRRLAVFSARQLEPKGTYAIEDLTATTLEKAALSGFSTKWDGAICQYGIAGALHLHHLANYQKEVEVAYHSALLSDSLDIPIEIATNKLVRLLDAHAQEWFEFLDSLGEKSFISNWVAAR
jgi:hypothetical protein